MNMAMKFASTADLKNRTNQLLRQVEAGHLLVVTRRGTPIAAVRGCTEDELEDLILETDPKIRESIARAEGELRRGLGIPLRSYRPRRRRRG